MIRIEIMNYFSEISQLLDKVPRQLLLILKTNDLLRSLEHSLGTSEHAQSYLTMSKHCITAISKYEQRDIHGWYNRACRRTMTLYNLFIICLYEQWLWFRYSLLV